MVQGWSRNILFWLVIASFMRYIFQAARMGTFARFSNIMTSPLGIFLIIAVIGVVFFLLCIAMLKTMLATADIAETKGVPAHSISKRTIQPRSADLLDEEDLAKETQPISRNEEVKPPVNYKKIASEIGTEAELRELERKEREELRRLEREGR